MKYCAGCATNEQVKANTLYDSSCILIDAPICVCNECLIKVVCVRKLECNAFCSQALIYDKSKSAFIRCLQYKFPSMYETLVLEGKINVSERL